MEQFLSYLVFNTYSLIGLSILLLLLLIQAYYYLFYYKKTTSYLHEEGAINDTHSVEKPSVSVIIIARNESENLIANLPLILSQDYPNFEVIVVNDGSTDESYFFLENLASEDSRLYHTFSPISEDDIDPNRRKILPMTIGIKAARNEILLFTEACSKPTTNHWISSMIDNLGNKDVVLGYSFFDMKNSFWNKVADFDNLMFSLQYLSMALKKKPFTGTYRNIAYRKHLFFDNKGFSSTLSYSHAEEIFLNRIVTENNTAISINKESFISTQIETFSYWKNLKMIYLNAKSHFLKFTPKRFILETLSRYLFLIIGIATITYSIIENLWTVLTLTILLFLIKYFMQFFILKKAFDQFETPVNGFLFPTLNYIHPIYNSNFLQASKHKRKRRKRK